MMFNNFADPVRSIVEKYFENKRFLSANTEVNTQLAQPYYSPDSLPQFPINLIRDESGKVYKMIYGNIDLIDDPDADIIIWSEEFIKVDGKLTQIITTYPDGTQSTVDIVRDINNRVVKLI